MIQQRHWSADNLSYQSMTILIFLEKKTINYLKSDSEDKMINNG